MKVFILCICVLGFASSSLGNSEIKQQFKSAAASNVEDEIESCLTENNVTIHDWYNEAEIMTGVHTEPENAEKTRNVGCTIACILKKKGLMENSNINERKVHAELSRVFVMNPLEFKAHKIARDCLKEVKNITEECDKSFSLFTCAVRAIHKLEKHEEHVKVGVENEETEHEEHNEAEIENEETKHEEPDKTEVKENEETEQTV